MAKGSIEKRGENSWRLRVDLGFNSDGTRNRPSTTIELEDPTLMRASAKCSKYKDAKGKLKEFLEDQLARFKIEVESGHYINVERMLFEKFVKEWEENYASDPENLSPTTYDTYKNHLRNHILPVFGKDRIDQIKPLKIVRFLKKMREPGARKNGSKKPLASGTIEVIYRVLKNIFSRAADWKVIAEDDNPMNGVEKPKVEYKKMDYYDENEARQALSALDKEPFMWKLFFIAAIVGGLRRGEIVGLEWRDVDFEENVLNIERNIPLMRKGQATIKDPKTKSSKAPVIMPLWYMKLLKTYELEWKKNYLENQQQWKSDRKFIFHSGLGKPIYYTYPTEWWKNFCTRHGLKYITVQNLRHSCATLLLEENIPMKKIQERLRHARYETTANIYTHVTKKGNLETASAFDKFASN